MDNTDKSNPTTQGTVPSRTAQGLSDTASRMQQALDQVSQLIQEQLQISSNINKSKLDPATSKQTDLNTLSFDEYQMKYGYNADNAQEYVRNQVTTKVNPQVRKEKLEQLRDDGSAGDFIADAVLGVASTGVNIIGGTIGSVPLIATDPLGAGVAASDMVGELASDFVGGADNYEDLIKDIPGSSIIGRAFGESLDEVSDTYAEVRNNVKEFLNTNGGLKQYPELAEVLRDDPILTKAVKAFGGATLEGTKALSDWIKSGQSDSLKARTQLRNEENQAYANKLREELGEDAGWVDHVVKNSKLLGMSALNLVTDPTATLYTAIESSPYLFVSGVTARIAGEVAFKKALKDKTDEITKKVNSEKLPHSNIPALIGNELSKSMDGINKIKEVTAAQAAILSTGVLEGTGAATEAYNLIIDTPYKTLEKSSERYRAMLLKEGLTQEEARKQLAIEYSMGNALAVGAMASTVSKMAGIDKAIKRTFGVTKTPSGTIPKAVSATVDAGKEGIEELVQSFVSSAVTGITERENIDPNKDVYGEASIAAGEGFVAGVGTSGIFSGARVVLDGVNTAAKGTKKYASQNVKQVRKARSIKDNGTTPADLDPTHKEFNFVGSLEGIYRRNLQEGVTEQEIDMNVNDANVLIIDYLDHIEKLNPIVDNQNVSQEVRDQVQTQIDKAKDDITKAFTTIEKMKVKQVDPTFEDSLTKAKEGDSSAATRVMGNMRTNPDSVSDTDAQALIDSGSLTPQEQEVVQKHINYVKTTKSLDEVNTDVMSGGKGFIGIQQYMNAIGSSLKVGNEAGAMKAFQRLKAFSKRHNQKAKDFSEALAIAQTPNKTPEQIARLAEINELYPNTSQPDLDTIHRGSGKLVEQTGLEAVALLNAVELAEANIQGTESTPTETSTETEASTPVEETEAVEEVTEAPVEEESITEPEAVNDTTDAVADNPLQQDLPPWDTTEDVTQPDGVQEEDAPKVTEPVQEEVQRTPEQVQAELDTALDNGDISSAATLANELDALDPQETITVLPRFAQGEYLNGVVPEQGTKVEEVEAASSPEERFKQYLSENLVSKYFRVRKGDTATKNPITEIKNLMETLAIRADDIIRAYTEEGDVTGKQKSLIKSLTDHHNTFKKLFEDIFVPSYNKTDNLMEYFMDNNVMPEEVLAAMSSATFNWISTGSGSTLYNSYDDVKKLLGLDESDDLPPKIYNQLSSGVFEQTLAEEIGKNILKNLGLTSLSTSPSNYQTNLENSLGLMAVNVLFKQGFLVRKEFPSHLFYTGEVADRFEELQTKFETLNIKKLKEIGTKEALELRALILPVSTLYTATSKKDADGIPKLHPVLQNIVEANKDTNGLLNKLFKAESHRTGPSDEPVTEANPKVRNSDQDTAPEYKETIVKHNATEHYLKDAQVKAFNSLSVDAQRDMFGYVEDITKIQQHNVDSVNSKNRAINASLNYYNEFTNGRKSDKPFFFNHELIKNERMLLVSNTFNPLGNKLHRHMTKIEGQDSTINLKDGDPTKTRNFLIAFGQSMGVKIDKMLNDDSVQIVLDLLGDPVVEDALNAIMNQEGDKYTAEQESAILAAIKKGGEEAWSLDGLVAMAGYIQAKNSGEATFTHDLMVEADGITNGPAIGTLQFGIGNSLDDVVERLKKVGINPKGDTQEYGDYIAQPTNKDNYESVTEELNNEVSTLNASGKRVADFGLFILGDLVKVNAETGEITFQRNISKGSLITTIYGAGQKSIKSALSKSVIDGIYDYIQENQDDVGKLQLLKDQLEKNMGIKVDGSLLSAPLKFKLDFRAELNIKKGIENTLGTSMVNAIDTLYGQFKEATTWINEAMGVVAETFQQIFAHAVSVREDEMVAEGLLARGRPTADNPKGALLEKLPRSEERKILEELRKAQPIVNSVLSATKEDAINEGLFVGKTKLSRAVGQQALQVRQKYSGIGRKTGSMFGSIREFISGGASPVVLMVQNIDATTMLRHLSEMVSFNVYDAIITGVDNILGHTRNMNKHFYEINRDHDISQEAKKAFERAEQAVKEYDAANGTNFAKEFNREKEISIGEGFTDIVVIREELIKAVEESTKRKERTMGIIGRMGQYGWEKAYFNVDGTIPNLVDNSIGSVTDEDIINRSLGSSPLGDQGDTQYKTSTQKKVDSMNVLDVFDEIGKLGNVRETAEHSAFLRDEINTLKGQLLNEVNLHLKDTLEDTIAKVEANDIYMYTQMFGGQKNSTAILNAGLRMSAQEALAHELWHTVSRHGIEGNSKARKELTRRWEQAKNSLDPTIFMDDPTLPESSPEYKEAKEAFEYIFTPRVDKSTTTINPTTGKTETKYYSNHLHEFAAYARTNAKMIAALKTVKDDAKTDTQPRLDDGSFLNSLYNKVLDILASVVDRLSVYLTNTKGLPQDQAVRELVKQLANIEATNKNRILNVVDTFDSSMGKLSGLVGTVAKKVNKPIIQIAESKFVKDNKSVFIRLPGRIVRILNDNAKAKYVLDAASNVQANLSKEKQGFSEQLITEARGLTNNLKSFHSLSRMKTKVIDGAVLELQSNLKTIFNKMFELVEPTDKDMEAVTRAFLKTDLSSLGLDLNKVLELVSNPAKVDEDIKVFEAPLRKDPNWNHFELQTKALGYFMATGKVTTSNLNFNAKQISQLFGTGKFNVNAAKVEKNIDMLTTLYALKYTDPAYKQRLAEFLKKNLAQGSSNGMNFLQEFHREQKKKDLGQVFQGSEVNFVKGHVREEFDPNISVVIAGPEEGAEYEARGWVKTELMKDPDDPVNSSMHMYVDTHGGETRTIGSIISFTSKQSRGTDTIKRRQVIGDNAPVYSGGRDTAVIFKRKERSYKAQLANSSTFDPTKASTGMAPMFDLNGEITGYRYMMNEKTKDKVLKRDTNAINVLSKGAASTLNKVETVAFNKQVIQATKDHFDANPEGNFLAIGPGVQDPELREIYARLPKEAKQNIQDIWGNKTMFVDRRTLTMLFGYRKYSLADELAKDKMNQSYAIQFLGAVNSLLGKPFGYSAEQVARTTGQYWQEYVSIAKDFLIIKSGIVTMVNAISNSTQLWTEGLSVVDVLKSQKEAVVELAKYREQSAELFELEKIVELGIEPAKEKANKVRIARLKAEISANPVTDVINDGLLQNIVEDVSLVDDQFTKGGKIKDAIDSKLLTKVPGFVREGAREVFQTKESYLYKKMSQSAQLSDFMARYALYKHSVGKEGLSREDAANKAISTFINYDLPTHRGIQYLNDMGMLWFTKYYIRIQKILLKTFINKPGRVISLLLMDFMTGDSVSTVYDSYLSTDNVLNRTGLPDDPIDLLGNLATASVI